MNKKIIKRVLDESNYILDTGKPRGYEIEDCPYWKDKKIEIDCRRIKLPGSFETIPTDVESED